MYTNIKGLPEGRKYFTEVGYSDRHPWVEMKRTAKTITIARVLVEADPEWLAEKDFTPGGFFGHCSNQNEQTWLFGFVDEHDTRTIRMTRRGWAEKGVRYLEDRAVEFYDYNF